MQRFTLPFLFALALLLAGPATAQFSFLGIKNSLVQFALEQISVPGELEITAEGVEENEEGATEIVGLAVADGAGVWLRIERLSVRWNASRILRGELEINRLAAIGVDVLRAPASSAVAVEVNEDAPIAQTDDDLFDWPRSPITVRVEELRLDRVAIAPDVIAPQSLAFDATGALRDEGDEQSLSLTVTRSDDIEGRIVIDFLRQFAENRLDLVLEADEAPGGIVAVLGGLPPDSKSRVRLNGTGPLDDWALDFDMDVDQVIAAAGTARLNATGRLAAQADFVVTPGPALSPAVATALSPTARLVVDIAEDEAGIVRIAQGDLTARDLTLTASGSFDRAQSIADLAIVLDARSGLSALAEGVAFDRFGFDGTLIGPLDDLTAKGQLSLDGLLTAAADVGSADLAAVVTVKGQDIAADVQGAVAALRIDKLTPDILGDANLTLRGTFADNRVTLDELRLAAAPLTVSASGNADLTAETAALSYALSAPDLAPIALAYDTDAAGAINATGTVNGPFSAARLVGRVDLTALAFQGESYGTVALTHDAVFDETPSGTASLVADGSRFGRASLKGGFTLDGALLALTDMQAAALGVAVDGDVTVNLDTTQAEGRIVVDAPDLSQLSTVTGSPVAGSVAGAVTLSARGAEAQDVVLDLNAARLAANRLRLGGLSLKGRVDDALRAPLADMAVRFSGADLGAAQIASGTATVKGGPDDLTIRANIASISAGDITAAGADLSARVREATGGDPRIEARLTATEGDLGAATLREAVVTLAGRLSALNVKLDTDGALSEGAPLALNAEARANLAASAPSATIATFRLTVDEGEDQAEIALRAPLTVRVNGGSTLITGIDLGLPGGGLTGSAALHANGLEGDLSLAIDDLRPLALLASVPVDRGGLALSAAFDTRPGRARATVAVDATNLRFADVVADIGALDLDADVTWDGRIADVTAALSGPFGDPFQVRAGIPLRPTGGLLPAPPPDGALTGSINWAGEIEQLWALVPAPGHVLAGATRVALTLGGTVADPSVGGDIAVSDGRYENLDTGTILVNLGVTSTVDSRGAFLVALRADDGAGKPVSADLAVSDGRVDARLAAEGATLVRRDDATAAITLDITAIGPLTAPAISGTVNIDRAEIRLVAANPPGIADIGEVRIKGEAIKPPAPPAGGDIPLNIDITGPQQIFVRGRGLDSEWSIDLQVRGTAAVPRITGLIAKRRGNLDFLGRLFDLERGTIRFTGGQTIDPVLDVQLLRDNDGVRGGIAVSGTALAPDISFVSRPGLPEEEVLPRVLFGRSKQSLSPTEAIQLGVGVATLLDGSGGAVDSVRGAVGLDVLRIDDDGEQTSVTVGTNIADGVFVGAKQPIGGGNASVQVEIEVFDNFSIDSEIGQTSGSSIGLKWKKDF